MKYWTLVLITALTLPAISFAGEKKPSLKSISIGESYIPQGFDANDRAQLVIEGTIGGLCYKIGPTDLQIDNKNFVIKVKQQVYYYNMPCDYIFMDYTQIVDLGILNVGNYKVLDQKSGKLLGNIPIKQSTTVAPDDFLYAPASEVQVVNQDRKIVIRGEFTNSCMRFKEILAKKDGEHVVVVLPVVELTEEACAQVITPFEEYVDLPKEIKSGERFLVHVRTLNGQAINKMHTYRE